MCLQAGARCGIVCSVRWEEWGKEFVCASLTAVKERIEFKEKKTLFIILESVVAE